VACADVSKSTDCWHIATSGLSVCISSQPPLIDEALIEWQDGQVVWPATARVEIEASIITRNSDRIGFHIMLSP